MTTPPTPAVRRGLSMLDRSEDQAADGRVSQLATRRAALRDRHAHGLTRLMEQRRDLRGVYPLADFVDDAVRWTA